MPIYEYECKECGNKFEKMQPIMADPLKECPHCGKSAIQRVFQPVGVIFKGSGWYITDSRKGSDTASRDKPDGGKGTDKAATENKSEAKTETPSSDEGSSSAAAPAKSTES